MKLNQFCTHAFPDQLQLAGSREMEGRCCQIHGKRYVNEAKSELLCLTNRACPALIVTFSTSHPALLSSSMKAGPCLVRASRLACRSAAVASTVPL